MATTKKKTTAKKKIIAKTKKVKTAKIKTEKADKVLTANEKIDQVVLEIDKRFGKGTIVRLANVPHETMTRTPTGILSLDIALGGGMPDDRMIYVKGHRSSLKTGLALKCAASQQLFCRNCGQPFQKIDYSKRPYKYGGCGCKRPEPREVCLLDIEGVFEQRWIERFGCDPDHFVVTQSEYAEQAIDIVDHLIRNKAVDFVIVDSVAAMSPMVEIEASSEDIKVAPLARLMNKALRKWASALNEGGFADNFMCTIFIINQYRKKIGITYGSPVTSPGGEGLEFFASIIIDMKKPKWIEFKERKIGQDVGFKVTKNKTAPPMTEGEFKFFFRRVDELGVEPGYVDNAGSLIAIAEEWGIVERTGAWYNYGDIRLGQGKDAAAQYVREDAETAEKIEDEVRAAERYSMGYDDDEEEEEPEAKEKAKKTLTPVFTEDDFKVTESKEDGEET